MRRISIHTSEPDEAEEICGQVYYPHRLTVLHEPARFAMTLSAISLGTAAVGLLGYADEVRLETAELETGYEINVPLSGSLRTWTGKAEVCATPATAAIYRPDGRTRLQGWAGGGRLFGLKIERSVLEAQLAELAGLTVRSVVPLSASLDLRTGLGRRWWALGRALMSLADDPAGPLARPIVARPLVESVISALLHAADHPFRDAIAAPGALPPPATISRAVDLLEAEPAAPWTVGDLASRVGLSTRGLQYGFVRHVGMPPTEYLRSVRLHRAHADLRSADPARHGVAHIAARWGFTNPGRFAAAYRERYGMAPSQTLREQG